MENAGSSRFASRFPIRMVTSIFRGSLIIAAIVFSVFLGEPERRSSSDLLRENRATSEPEKNAEKNNNMSSIVMSVSIPPLYAQSRVPPVVRLTGTAGAS